MQIICSKCGVISYKSPLYYRPYFHKILKIQSVTFENHLMTKGDTQYEKGVTFKNQVI